MEGETNSQRLSLEAIGTFSCDSKEKYEVAKQGTLLKESQGTVHLHKGYNYEQALEDLKGFDRIWLLFYMHRVNSWKPKVLPPHSFSKRSVFATRSPHRPNPIGLSCVKLLKIEGCKLYIQEHDILDGSLILDIKPYLIYSDCFSDAKQGWLDEQESTEQYELVVDSQCQIEMKNIQEDLGYDIYSGIYPRLSIFPFPKSSNRIKAIKEKGKYEIAYKYFRVYFYVNEAERKVYLYQLISLI
ncbi:MAG: tRNA (N6-threonylcarbamoyladenosine(37)-N6)-methyltransferase TrmO [Chlamydiales bacterium]|nr:tRNA (N6-threonylcarbamoyladenosine(37)-N6)-methyltransferase TrmO [Chlamydiales bacterium]